MTPYSRGDVVLINFPFTSGIASKQRPGVIISSETYNEGPDVLIASITSHLTAVPHHGDHVIRDWRAAGLLRPSLAQAKIATVAQELVTRRLGRLSVSDLAAVEAGLQRALGLS